ncbi:hypothetical protein IAT38_002511 [Cryptococcus sp. DSM 104549]
MPEARMSHSHSHSSHHHQHPSHSSHHSYSHGPPQPYPPSSSHPSAHPSYNHHPHQHPHPQHQAHHSSRHVSNGHPAAPPVVAAGPPPPQMALGGPPPEAVGPPPVATPGPGNGTMGPPMSTVARAAQEKMNGILAQLATANENTWMLIGAVAEGMNDQDRAVSAFENALRHNPSSLLGLNAVASIARSRDQFDKAIEYFQRILNTNPDNGEVWGSMGHCLLMQDDLPKAYTSYQQALYHLPNPKEPKLWYGIGILYDRYGSFEHAEEAFSSVLKVDPNFEKANEIYFRLGIIYKHQRKYSASLDCFRYILNNPPRPLTSWDIWFQLGHVYEQNREFENARDAYMRVLSHQPDHAKVLQQLGWLYHQPGASFADQDKAVAYLTRSLETDGSDAQSWYLLGRAYMAAARYNKAYEAYQQAVYRDGRNPTFWCSIGVLYYQINQYRDALDAYSRAIRLNPYISEVWYNLGSLYESCNNQIADAMDAYSRAIELDPTNSAIKQRLHMLRTPGSGPLPPVPAPVDVHPSQYTATPSTQQPPSGQSPDQSSSNQLPANGPSENRDLPPPPPGGDFARGHSPGPFRNGAGVAPPPLNHVDESRGAMSGMAPLARMEVDPRAEAAPSREREREVGPPAAGFNGRYDPAAEAASRRHAESESPRSGSRRGDAPPFQAQGPPGYGFAPPAGAAYPRDREREEWERSRAGSRAPTGPSPRMQDRDPRIDPRQPSPRMHHEYREYTGGAPGSRQGEYPPGPGYPYDARGQYPPGPPGPPGSAGPAPVATGRFDPRQEAESYRRQEARRYDERSEPNGSVRHPSVSREELRGPSPAPSASSRNGGSTAAGPVGRKRGDSVARRGPASVKEPQSRKPSGGDKRGDKDKLRVARPEEDNGLSPRGTNASSPAVSVRGTPQPISARPIMSRTLDEDYDEGAADALMALHGDRPPSSKTSSIRQPTPTPATPAAVNPSNPTSPLVPPSLVVGNKRPPGPEPISPDQAYKRAKAEKSRSPTASVTGSTGAPKRTIIEVLNAPTIASPLPRTSSAMEVDGENEKEKEAPAAVNPPAEQEREKSPAEKAAEPTVERPAPVEEQQADPEPAKEPSPRPATPALPPTEKPPTPAAAEPQDTSRPPTPPIPQEPVQAQPKAASPPAPEEAGPQTPPLPPPADEDVVMEEPEKEKEKTAEPEKEKEEPKAVEAEATA